jgi:hypothetical protein
MIRRGSSRLGCVLTGCSWWWFSEPSFGGFLGVFSGPCSWGFCGGCMCEPFVVLFPLIPFPNTWVKELDFGIFGSLELEVFLVGFIRFLLIWQVLVDKFLVMDSPWGVPTIPKVLCKSVERFGRSGFGFGGVDTQVLFILTSSGHTGLTGASHRSDRCRPLLGFARVSSLLSCGAAVSSWVSLELGRTVWCFGAFWLGPVWPVCFTSLAGVELFCGSRQVSPAGAGLTGGAHRPDRCR